MPPLLRARRHARRSKPSASSTTSCGRTPTRSSCWCSRTSSTPRTPSPCSSAAAWPGTRWSGSRANRLPTLGEMIRHDDNVVVLVENEGGAEPWYIPAYDMLQDTPYTFEAAERLHLRPRTGRRGEPAVHGEPLDHGRSAEPRRGRRGQRARRVAEREPRSARPNAAASPTSWPSTSTPTATSSTSSTRSTASPRPERRGTTRPRTCGAPDRRTMRGSRDE